MIHFAWFDKKKTKTNYYCGHCGKIIDEMKDFYDITLEFHCHLPSVVLGKDVSLCNECFAELWKIVGIFCTNQLRNGDKNDRE